MVGHSCEVTTAILRKLPSSAHPMSVLTMSRRFRAAPLVGLAVALAACDGGQQMVGYCAAPRSIAIEVTVTDSASGLPLADSTTGNIVAGSISDSLHHVSDTSAVLYGGDQRGTYDVSLSHPGYAPWSRQAVAVTQLGRCGNVVPVALTALLQPLP